MSADVVERIRQAASDVFGVPLADVSVEASPATLEAWDSVAHLNLVLALEQSFGLQFTPEEIASMTSLLHAAEVVIRKQGGGPRTVPAAPAVSPSVAAAAPATRAAIETLPAPVESIAAPSPVTPVVVEAPAASPVMRSEIRLMTPDDVSRVTALLSERDGSVLKAADVSTAVDGLDPEHVAGWLAFVDGEPAGMTMLFLRSLRWGDRTVRAGYWAHLFVRERARRVGVYPELVLAMMHGIEPLGIDVIVAATRRPHVARGHAQLGLEKLGELPVLFDPVRPLRFLGRYRRWPAVAATAGPGDALYGAWRAIRRPPMAGWRFRECATQDAEFETLVAWLADAGAERVSQIWTAESLRRRLAGTIDGGRYTILVAEHGGRPAGALVYRIAPRERVLAGVILDLVSPPGEGDALRFLLAEAERRIERAGADTTLYLDGLGAAAGHAVREAGHRVSRDTYSVLVWPKRLVPSGNEAHDLAHWRFGFLDHDAF